MVILFHTGCGMVVTTGYPYTAHKITYIHNLFQNGAATLSGVVEMFEERKSRGEIPKDEKITFIMVTGDGGHDIGMGPSIGAAMRNHKMIICEYDNQGYQNTGSQLPPSPSPGAVHLDVQLRAAPARQGHAPQGHGPDLRGVPRSVRLHGGREQPARHDPQGGQGAEIRGQGAGLREDDLHVPPAGVEDGGADVRSDHPGVGGLLLFPILYEVEYGITTINYDPEEKGEKGPRQRVAEAHGKTKPGYASEARLQASGADRFQAEVDRRWVRLKELSHKNPLL